MDEIDFDQLRRDLWPMSNGWESQYALGALDLQTIELNRRARLAHKQSKVLLDIALHPENYTSTD